MMTNKRKEDSTSTGFLRLLLKTFLFLNFPRRAVFENRSRLARGDRNRYKHPIFTFCMSLVKQVTLDNIFKYIQTCRLLSILLAIIKIQLGSEA